MPLLKHSGWGLLIGGGLIAAMFLAFIFIVPHGSSADSAPLWIGAIWALLAVVWGLFRLIAGPSRLDHPNGGTDAGA